MQTSGKVHEASCGGSAPSAPKADVFDGRMNSGKDERSLLGSLFSLALGYNSARPGDVTATRSQFHPSAPRPSGAAVGGQVWTKTGCTPRYASGCGPAPC